MENASKALIIVASILVGIMLLSFFIYVFKTFNATAAGTEERLSKREIESFNAKFLNYETGGNHSIDDNLSYIDYSSGGGTSKVIKYKQIFNSGTSEIDAKVLIAASQSLNKVSSVVTAINDAIDINERNNNNYRYNSLEIQNSVEIIVDLGGYEFEFSKDSSGNFYRYLVIEPRKNLKPRYIYRFKEGELPDLDSTTDNTNNKVNRANKFQNVDLDARAVKTYSMLEELRDTKSVILEGKSYSVNRYYFMGQVFINDYTDLVDSVRFTLIKDEKNF